MIQFQNYSLALIFWCSVVVVVISCEVGRRLGAHALRKGGGNVAILEGAILGLLSLMIGFTFALSLSLYETRRDAVLKDANAIGTTALRAQLLPAPYGAEVLKLLHEYTRVRLDITTRVISASALDDAIARSNAINTALWEEVKAIASRDNAIVPTGLFIQTLNDMIDMNETRLTAWRNHIPNIVLWALYGIAIVSSAFTGYSSGLDSRRSRLPVYVVGISFVAAILLIQDLDRPNDGFVKISQQPIIDTAAGLGGD